MCIRDRVALLERHRRARLLEATRHLFAFDLVRYLAISRVAETTRAQRYAFASRQRLHPVHVIDAAVRVKQVEGHRGASLSSVSRSENTNHRSPVGVA